MQMGAMHCPRIAELSTNQRPLKLLVFKPGELKRSRMQMGTMHCPRIAELSTIRKPLKMRRASRSYSDI
ncbi:hypothetical protein ACH5RR_003367 [Cinchona calisaya]|uniref:Uncharacterized protein n=1 Tax=Cinchona calisaya TaxID=153742 RepID=A0ABD3AUZ4_9GENT